MNKGQMAREYADHNQKSRPQIAWVLFDVKEAFIAGFDACIKSASEGFEAWFKVKYGRGWCPTRTMDIDIKEAWQASLLSMMKTLEGKDKEIAELKAELELKDSWVKHHQKACEIAMKDRHDADKEIAELKEKLEVANKKNEQLKIFWKPVLEKFEGDQFQLAHNKIALGSLTEAFDIFCENDDLKQKLSEALKDLKWALQTPNHFDEEKYEAILKKHGMEEG